MTEQPTAYHPDNVKMVAKDTGYSEESIIAVAEFAASVGVLVKIDGIPFGKFGLAPRQQNEISESA